MKNGSFVWLSNREKVPNALVEQFGTPIKIRLQNNYFTCQPAGAGGYMQILQYGENITNVWNCIANANCFLGKIKQGDLMWVEGDKPTKDVPPINSATARVVSVNISDKSIFITLERNQTKDED